MSAEQMFEANRKAWNTKTGVHVQSKMYEIDAFKQGKSTLREVDLQWLGTRLKGKKVLHLQCHFGLDSFSLERLGANVTAMDLSDKAIKKAREMGSELGMQTEFICCNIYDLKNQLNDTFDWVFTSYGTIGWLPDLTEWSRIIDHFLKPGGHFFMAEFHPFIWTLDENYASFGEFSYFFQREPFVEDVCGTYTDRNAPIRTHEYSWNHHLGEVLGNLLDRNLVLERFEEFNYSPWPCFPDLEKVGEERWVFKKWGHKVPYFYALIMSKPA